jgi:hypothetical protein
VSKVKAVGVSIVDTMVFASYTVLPMIGVMWATGIVSLNI